MSPFADFVLLNALSALLLAAAVAGGTRFIRMPAVAHVLWLLVLLRLFAPPLLEIGVLPRLSSAAPSGPPVTMSRSLPDGGLAALVPAAPAGGGSSLRLAGLMLWGAGSAVVIALAVTRARRFGKLVRRGHLAPCEVRARVLRIARGMGLRRAPETRLVPARIPPSLWHRPGALRLLLPQGLLERLSPAEQDALIAHELAHVRRRDHWVRYLELAATAVYWWNPVVWWARRGLRREEEQCCDAWVLGSLGARPRDYGRALVKTVEFLAGPRVALPALACGAAGAASLKERLTMILDRRLLHAPTRLQRAVLVVIAGASLLFFPTWAQREDAAPPDDGELQLGLIQLERRAADLEAELSDVRARQIELQRQFQQRAGRHELDRLRNGAERAQAAGREDEAREALAAAEQLQRRTEIELRHAELEHARSTDLARLEAKLRRAQLEAAELEATGAGGRAAAARAEAAAVEARLAERAAEIERAGRELERLALDEERHALAGELERLREAGDESGARRLAFELRRLESEAELREAGADEAEPIRRKLELERMAIEMQAVEERLRELRDELDRQARTAR